jgi:formylglycine-generating enzyme required for sulfatase activity
VVARDDFDRVVNTGTVGTQIVAKTVNIARPGVRPCAAYVSTEEVDHYLRKAAAKHELVPMLGFKTKVRLSLHLEDLYVPLDAAVDCGQRGADLDAVPQNEWWDEFREELPLVDAFQRAHEFGRRGLLLLGEPGSGKTTHLKQVLLKVVRDGAESIGLPSGTIPVFLPLNALRNPDAGLPNFIAEQLRDPMLDVAPDFAARLCKHGKLLLLLDGLDEVANSSERAAVSRWIEALRTGAIDSHVLVSCRYAGYADKNVELSNEFLELHLRPLDYEKMRVFVDNWYAVVERELIRDEQRATVRAKQRAAALLAALEEPELSLVHRVHEMTRNPLLLTAICIVYHEPQSLPHARAKLYQECIAVLLERWRKSRTDFPLTTDEALAVLRPVAAWMQEERDRTRAIRAELYEPVAAAMGRASKSALEADHFLKVIRDDAGLLTGFGMDQYGFIHLGFQELLTAEHLRNEGLIDSTVFDALAAKFDDNWWQEVILLMLGLRNPSVFEPFMQALLRRPEFVDWSKSATMQLCFTEAATPSLKPFVGLLMTDMVRGWMARIVGWKAKQAEDLARRQVAALRLLARAMPSELLAIKEELPEHLKPVQEVVVSALAYSERHEQESRRLFGRSSHEPRIVYGIIAPRGGVELVKMPGGRFNRTSWQGLHVVELSTFYLARTPVTNAQYGEYLAANPHVPKPGYWEDQRFNQPRQPVVGVSRMEAQRYCDWAGVGLPTEIQWEYACRAEHGFSKRSRYWSGHRLDDLARVGWYAANSGRRLHPVAEKEPNQFGLYDMHGNILEWCRDAYENDRHLPRPGDGLTCEPPEEDGGVLRGGYWNGSAADASFDHRTAGRGWLGISFGVGFRPVRVRL